MTEVIVWQQNKSGENLCFKGFSPDALIERRRRDSNPRTGDKTDKLISSQPRYGHFGTSPRSCCQVRECILWHNSRNIITRLDGLEKGENLFFLPEKRKA